MFKKLSVLLALLVLMMSCGDEILDVENVNQYSDATYFEELPQFNEAVIATYSVLLHRGLYARDYYFLFDLLGNDAEKDAPLLGDLAQLTDFSYGSSHAQITDLWRSLYRMAMRSNLVLNKIQDFEPQGDAEAALKSQYIGEAHFLRAFAYMNLVANWGRVPLITDFEASRTELFSPRASEDEVWRQVVNDFSEAANRLPVSYPDEMRGRATKGAALALLGRSHMYRGQYAEAIDALEPLTGPEYSYELDADYDNLFSPTNGDTPEAIFQVVHSPWQGWGVGNAFYMFGGQEFWGGVATHTGRAMEYGWNDWRNVFISDAVVAGFTYEDESGATYVDPRAALTFYGAPETGGDTDYCNQCPDGALPYPYEDAANGNRWRKYNLYEYEEKHNLPQSPINSNVIRYADVLLLLAEAYIQTGRVSDALPLINQVRARVGAFEYTSLGNQTEALEKLMLERQIELAGEQLRWYDLRRWGIIQETINDEKEAARGFRNFEPKHILLPIPQLERDLNPAVAGDISDGWN